jgi:hypothetical protein
MTRAYRIADEPVPGRWAAWVVNPVFPLMAGMLGGFLPGLAWFLVNGAGMGSATRRQEWAVAAGALALLVAGSVALLFVVPDDTPRALVKLHLLGLQLTKLTALYVIQSLQARSFALHQYFDGPVKNGIPGLVILAIARGSWVEALPTVVALVIG